jgi:hypothetical protein
MKSIPALLALAGLLSTLCAAADVESTAATGLAVKTNRELAQLYSEDQADRQPKDGKWTYSRAVRRRDEARLKRVMEIYRAGELKTGWDYFHAAIILQHGRRKEDYLLSHELCVTAVFNAGNEKADWVGLAKWLAAASEDRFLLEIHRAQRFGTQFKGERRARMEDGVTDALRKMWNVPPLAEAKENPAEKNKK